MKYLPVSDSTSFIFLKVLGLKIKLVSFELLPNDGFGSVRLKVGSEIRNHITHDLS